MLLSQFGASEEISFGLIGSSRRKSLEAIAGTHHR